jgi:two-component system, OmpR family, sensor histidine kinase KdpD
MQHPRSLFTQNTFLRYGLAVVIVALTTLVLFRLRESLSTPVIALLYLLPVVVSASLWGLGPGIVAALCAFLAFNFLFIPPYYTFAVHQARDVVALLVFLIVAVVISQLVGQAQAGMAAATAREREATRLYELSTALAGLHDDQAIARTVAEQALQTFRAERVALSVEVPPGSGERPFTLHLPAQSPSSSRPPEGVIPLQTARGLQGEICLWREASPLTSSEERLLRTFASQGALALERARLSQAETRAKVLEESDRLKSALLSSVSHELRSPLATIKASVTSLRSEAVTWDSNARQELLAAMDEETDHLNRLVGNLLDMSRIEAGVLRPERKWNALAEIVGGVAARMRQAAREHRLEIDVSDDLPLVPVDYVQMEQVFTNLISNSLKYAPVHTTIRIGARVSEPGWVKVQVSNQGPSVPEEHLERIFDKFYRVTAADRVTGTGLGLSICKGIVEAHGGRIWAENLSNGLAFNFTLPQQWEGLAPPQPPLEPEEA